MSLGQFAVILALIALNAFFTAIEYAVLTARRSRLDLLPLPGGQAGDLVKKWLDDENTRARLTATAQLGTVLVSLTLGAVGVSSIESLLKPRLASLALPSNPAILQGILSILPLVISLAVIASFHVVLGEQVPKAAVSHAPEQFALRAAPVMRVFTGLLGGYLHILNLASRGLLALLGLPADGSSAHTAAISTEELKQMVAGPEVKKTIEQSERELISAVIEFGGLVVRQVSVPRLEIIAIEAATPITEAVRIAAQNGVTKLPVYEDNLDQIVGILHLRDLLPALIEESGVQQRCARELAREALFVPESIPVNDLLIHMRARRQHMAITLDEFGGTAGLVTLEDLLEEIVGDVQDPFDVDLPEIEHLPDGSALIDGMSPIEDVNQHFGLNLFDPNYDTIAGYLLGKLGRIPQPGDAVDIVEESVRLKVHTMDRLRIARIHLSKL